MIKLELSFWINNVLTLWLRIFLSDVLRLKTKTVWNSPNTYRLACFVFSRLHWGWKRSQTCYLLSATAFLSSYSRVVFGSTASSWVGCLWHKSGYGLSALLVFWCRDSRGIHNRIPQQGRRRERGCSDWQLCSVKHSFLALMTVSLYCFNPFL